MVRRLCYAIAVTRFQWEHILMQPFTYQTCWLFDFYPFLPTLVRKAFDNEAALAPPLAKTQNI